MTETSAERSAGPCHVPWRARDALKVILWSYLTVVVLVFAMVFAIGVALGPARLGSPDPSWLLSLFRDSPWTEYWYLIQGLLSLLFLSVFILRPYSVRLSSFFVVDRAGPDVRAGEKTAGVLATEVRYASRLLIVAVMLSMAVIGVLAVAVWIIARPLTHGHAAVAVSAYLQGRTREAELLLSPRQMSWFRVVVIIFLAPPLEELVFRGCFYAALRKRMAAWPANLISSALFAASHAYLFNLPNVFVIGMLAAYAYERTRSLRTPIVFHLLWNAVGVASVKPWLWFVLAGGGLLLWLRRPRRSPSQDRRLGWKIYAPVITGVLVVGYALDRSIAWQFACDIPLVAAAWLYAWKKTVGPRSCWKWYAVSYATWVAMLLWAAAVPEAARAPWQRLLAGSEPIKNLNDLLVEVSGYLVFEGPAMLAVYRLATPRDAPARGRPRG